MSIPKIAGQWHPSTATKLYKAKNTKRLVRIDPASGSDHYSKTEMMHVPWSMNEYKVKIMLANRFTHHQKKKIMNTKNGDHLRM